MNKCYIELQLDIYPFSRPVEDLLNDDWPENRMDKLHTIDHLNPDLVKFFADHDVNLRDTFLLINWWTLRERPAHTDGDWFSDDKIVKKRPCGINWNFTPDTWVEFYDTEGVTPFFNPKGRIDDATIWPKASKVVDRWDTAGPIIFNPQIPHRVRSLPSVPRRVSTTLRFVETYESLAEKLKEFIKPNVQ